MFIKLFKPRGEGVGVDRLLDEFSCGLGNLLLTVAVCLACVVPLALLAALIVEAQAGTKPSVASGRIMPALLPVWEPKPGALDPSEPKPKQQIRAMCRGGLQGKGELVIAIIEGDQARVYTLAVDCGVLT